MPLRAPAFIYQDIPYDFSVSIYDLSPEEAKGALWTDYGSGRGEKGGSLIREVLTESWLERDQFGPYLRSNCIDRELFSSDEEGRYLCSFQLIALGEDEFNPYAAANGLDAEAFQDTENFRGILINKGIVQGAHMPSMSRCS